MAKKRIGEVLLERQAITKAQLESALMAQRRTRQRLGITLIQQGIITEAQLATTLAESLELQPVDLRVVPVDWSAVHLLRGGFCENHELFPFAIEGKGTNQRRLVVAMSDPLNQTALEEIEFTTGLAVAPRVATHSQIREAILRYYHKTSAPEAVNLAGSAPPIIGRPTPVPQRVPVDEEPAVVVGQVIAEPTFDGLMPPAGAKRPSAAGVKGDLDFLFGQSDEGTVQLEKKFWALMRLLTRKGLITRDEFLRELDEQG